MLDVAIVVNKSKGSFNFSETFLQAHIDSLPFNITPVIGNPNRRRDMRGKAPFIQSRNIVPLGLRWGVRKLGLSTVQAQDTRAMTRFLTRNRYDAVLAEYGTTAASVTRACVETGTPLIAHFHGFDAYSHYVIETYRDRYAELFRHAHAVIAVSRHMQQQLISLGADPSTTFYNSCGADLADHPGAQPGNNAPRFVMVGRLIEKKAPFLSILAFSQVARAVQDATLDVIGDGPLNDACQQLAQALGLSERIHFHGALPHSGVLEYLSNARCFIQHSVRAPDGDHEGTPVAVLEAMGMGLPVVSTRHGGIADAIASPELGTLVDELDVDGMAAGMLRMAQDTELAARIGERARQEVRENWTLDKSVARLGKIIEDVARPVSGGH